jgi:hypothetical protein
LDDSEAQVIFTAPLSKKNLLSFILNEENDPKNNAFRYDKDYSQAKPRSINHLESSHPDEQNTKKKKRKARICKTEGCDKYVVDQGLCIRHGVSTLKKHIKMRDN